MSSTDILKLAGTSGERDFQILLKAKLEAQNAHLAAPDNPELKKAYLAAKKLADAEEARQRKISAPVTPATSPEVGRLFKSQRQAVLFLQNLGYKVTTSTFSNHCREGHIPTNALGQFEEVTLRSYANLKLDAAEKRAAADGLQKSLEKTSADARLKNIQADRQQLMLERERGKLMPVADYEKKVAARALFFRREIENYIQLHGPALIALVGGREETLPELLQYWADSTAEWMHAWSAEREFVVELDFEPPTEKSESLADPALPDPDQMPEMEAEANPEMESDYV